MTSSLSLSLFPSLSPFLSLSLFRSLSLLSPSPSFHPPPPPTDDGDFADIILCEKPAPIFQIILGVFLIVGIQLSYVPQHIALIRIKSSKGINFVMLLLGNISCFSNTLNALLFQWNTLRCCRFVSFAQCNVLLLSVYQLAIGLFNLYILYILLLVFFKSNFEATPEEQEEFTINDTEDEDESHGGRGLEKIRINKRARFEKIFAFIGFFGFLSVYFLGNILLAVLLVQFTGVTSPWVKTHATILGVISGIANLLMYSPQILSTWKIRSAGSLSVTMILLQAPGSFLVVYFQASSGADVTTWVPYIITGIQQVILAGLCLYFQRLEGMRKKEDQKGLLSEESDESLRVLR